MDSDASQFTFRDLKVEIWHSIPAGKHGMHLEGHGIHF